MINNTPYSKKDTDNRISELTNMDTNDKIEQYIVTIPQIVEIVSYCSKMTIAGSHSRKDWTGNVETAIYGINGVGYCTPKIKLTKASNLIHQAEITAFKSGYDLCAMENNIFKVNRISKEALEKELV